MLHVMNGVTRSVAAFFDRYDLLLTPTLGAPPLPFGQISLDRTGLGAREFMDLLFRFIPYTPLANFTGDPAISLPLVQTADNLPIGIQAMAAYGREDLLLSFANSVEDAQPWAGRKPAVSIAGEPRVSRSCSPSDGRATRPLS
jgi:amidase